MRIRRIVTPPRRMPEAVRPSLAAARAESIRIERRTRTRVAIAAAASLVCALGGLIALCVADGVKTAVLSTAVPGYVLVRRAAPAPEPESVQTISVRTPVTMRISVEKVAPAAPVAATDGTSAQAPYVLIYHTHATEAYLMTEDAPYTPSAKWRTNDADRSVIAVGERLCTLLNETYGVSALHDTENHEPPKLSTAYSRSLETMQAYKAKYPSLRCFIDVHRDAYGKEASAPKDYVVIDGVETARLMFVVGTGEGATGQGFAEMPDYAANLALAERITALLSTVDKGLTREVRIKTGRYNQHVSDQCLLVEVGHTANSFAQAMAAADRLAAAVAEALLDAEGAAMETTAVWTP